ncbi:MAG: hypothetical protein II225_02940, partial [Ruminococcus sp.]|nr:hypothetical protein [Ruminococcus sp.]
MMKKRLMCLVMAVLMLVSAVPFAVSAKAERIVVSATVVQELTNATCFEGAEEYTADLSGLRIFYELSDGT